MASSTLEVTDLGYKVADLSLADWAGRKSPSPSRRCRAWCRSGTSCGREPCGRGADHGVAAHDDQTAVLIETLVSWRGGALGELHFSRRRTMRGGDRRVGVPGVCMKGESLEEYWWCTFQA